MHSDVRRRWLVVPESCFLKLDPLFFFFWIYRLLIMLSWQRNGPSLTSIDAAPAELVPAGKQPGLGTALVLVVVPVLLRAQVEEVQHAE